MLLYLSMRALTSGVLHYTQNLNTKESLDSKVRLLLTFAKLEEYLRYVNVTFIDCGQVKEAR